MRRIEPETLAMALQVWLGMAPRWAQVALTARDDDTRDGARAAVVRFILDRLARSGWHVIGPPIADPLPLRKADREGEARPPE